MVAIEPETFPLTNSIVYLSGDSCPSLFHSLLIHSFNMKYFWILLTLALVSNVQGRGDRDGQGLVAAEDNESLTPEEREKSIEKISHEIFLKSKN